MRPWIKILIGVVCGFAGGFAAGFLSHKKMNDIQFEEVSEEEMKEIEESIQNNKKAVMEAVDKTFSKPAADIFEKEDLPTDPEKLRLAFQGKTPYIKADQDQKMQYEKLWKATKEYSNEENANDIPVEASIEEGPGEEEFDEDFLEMIEEEAVDPGSSFVEPPHQITLSEFYNERNEFDKITIEWYEEDNVWVDENEEVIDDISAYIGSISVSSLFAQRESSYDDPDVRFVRNEGISSDYEIIRHHRSWAEETGGVE